MLNFESLKKDKNFFWTNHSKGKMLQYGTSPNAVKKVINRPDRVEIGIAPDTTAVMKRKDTKKTKRELWVMYQIVVKSPKLKVKSGGRKTRIISTWIYPGISPKGKEIFIPEDVWEELS